MGMLEMIGSLWLAVVAATFVVWIASFVLWAVLPWHHREIKKTPDREAFDVAVRALDLRPGFYMEPQATADETMKSESFQRRYADGPWVTVNVMPARPSMGKNMILTVLVFGVVNVLIAYLAGSTLEPGAPYMEVFRVTCVAAVLAYTFGGIANGIWFGKPTGWAIKDVIDAGIYASLTAGVFAWQWPAAAVVA